MRPLSYPAVTLQVPYGTPAVRSSRRL